LEEDEAHVMTLARDIAEHTLLQPGLGRRVDGRVQIAFAHSRLAAFKFLNVTGDATGHFSEFPVIIRELSDRQMSDYTAAENAKRKNLSAIEVASAIQKRIADFGLTQLEAGEPFGYMSQSSVAHLLSLLKLPSQAKNFVNERLLPERLARRLVPFVVIAPDTVIEIADKVAGAPDSERDDVFQDAVQELLAEHGQFMRDLWPLDWNPGEANLDGEWQAIAKCKGCDFRMMVMGDYHCARPTCYAVKKKLWTNHELARLSERLGVPIAGSGDTTIKPISIEWNNDDRAKAYLKRKIKPNLYVMPNDGQLSSSIEHYHQRLLDCPVVLLGSTNSHLFDPTDDKPANGKSVAADVSSGVEETPAARAKRIEREEAEAEERREARSAIRKARYDLVWLIMHNAEMLAVDLPITGGIATYCAELTQR
jgi:ParB/RepB/Spo0J family partition protein